MQLQQDLLDWYLGKTDSQTQQTHELADPNRLYNLWEPGDGTHSDLGEGKLNLSYMVYSTFPPESH